MLIKKEKVENFMKLYDYLKMTENDFDVLDTVFDTSVTVCYIEENSMQNDNYEKFCIELAKKVEMEKIIDDIYIVAKWTELIQNNMEKFKEFTENNWKDECQYDDDDDEFIYQWIEEIHRYMAGMVWDDFYKELVKLVETLEA
jgi:hypothetical protein